jgi:hypothetical protein
MLSRGRKFGPALSRYAESFRLFPFQPRLAVAVAFSLGRLVRTRMGKAAEPLAGAAALAWGLLVLARYLAENQGYFANKFASFLPLLRALW